MADAALSAAFDAALRQVDRALRADMRDARGEPARARLEHLRDALLTERTLATARGEADPQWVRVTVRDVAGWTPESELGLLAALGAIARASRGDRAAGDAPGEAPGA